MEQSGSLTPLLASRPLDSWRQGLNGYDPVVRGVLQRIARDEQAHAELAFKFMRWALAQSSPEVWEEIALEAERGLASYECDTNNRVRASAARHVVRPLLTAILSLAAEAA